MARRRRSTRVKINQRLLIDIVGAGLIVKNLPKLINTVIPLDPMISTIAAVGGGYVTGVFLKRPDLANASIAVGIAQIVDPFIDQLFGGVGVLPRIPAGAIMQPIKTSEPVPAQNVSDYIRLNDYIVDPSGSMPAAVYSDAY